MSEGHEPDDDFLVTSIRVPRTLRKRGEVTASARGEDFSKMVRTLVEDEADRLGVTDEVAARVKDGDQNIIEALGSVKSEREQTEPPIEQ